MTARTNRNLPPTLSIWVHSMLGQWDHSLTYGMWPGARRISGPVDYGPRFYLVPPTLAGARTPTPGPSSNIKQCERGRNIKHRVSKMAKLQSFYHFFCQRGSDLGFSEAAHWMATDCPQPWPKTLLAQAHNHHNHSKRYISPSSYS